MDIDDVPAVDRPVLVVRHFAMRGGDIFLRQDHAVAVLRQPGIADRHLVTERPAPTGRYARPTEDMGAAWLLRDGEAAGLNILGGSNCANGRSCSLTTPARAAC